MKSIQETVASVQNAPSSIFTKEDVISLLNKITIPEASEQVATGLTKDQIEELCKKVVAQVKENADNLDSSDVVDTSSAEFSLSYNEIQLDSVDIDTRNIVDEVVCGIGDVIEEYFEELNKENEEDDSEEDNN